MEMAYVCLSSFYLPPPTPKDSFSVVVSAQLIGRGKRERKKEATCKIQRFVIFSFACAIPHRACVVDLFLTECLCERTKLVSRSGNIEIRSELIKGTESNH